MLPLNPAGRGLLASSSFCWLLGLRQHHSSLRPHPHMAIFPLCLCPNRPLLPRTLVILDEGYTPLQDDVIVTDNICSHPIPKEGHTLSYQRLVLQYQYGSYVQEQTCSRQLCNFQEMCRLLLKQAGNSVCLFLVFSFF